MDLRKTMRDRRQRLWLALARAGNEDAFRRLYRELFEPISHFVGARVSNREDAQDVTSRVFEKFLVNLDGFDPARGSVMSWILTMARHAVIDHYRRNRTGTDRMLSLEQVIDQNLADSRPEPLQAVIGDQQYRRLRRTLNRQPADIREMFALRFEQGLSVKEVAGVMGISTDAAKQRFARTLRRLKQELEADDQPRRGEKTCTATD